MSRTDLEGIGLAMIIFIAYPVLFRTVFRRKKSTFCAFVDMEKVFDKIDRNLFFYSLLNYYIKGKIYKAIKSPTVKHGHA